MPKTKPNQVQSVITQIMMNEKTYENETFQPTLINYFYGKNGTGKTTISEFIKSPTSAYPTTLSRDDFELLVYNKDFITEEIQSYGNIPSLFTITKKNADVNKDIERLEADKKGYKGQEEKANQALQKYRQIKNNLGKKLLSDIWQNTESLRGYYSEALKRAGTKQGVLDQIKAVTPVQHGKEELETLFARCFGPDDEKYPYFKNVPTGIDVPETPLSTPIVSSGTTPFAKFVEEIRASDWIRAGHDRYQHAAGETCPYCQQKLPDNFEAKLASCFDRSYQRQVEELQACSVSYAQKAQGIIGILKENTASVFIGAHTNEYVGLCKAIEAKLISAVETWKRKVDEPASTFTIPDIREELAQINECIEKINQEIKAHNDIIDNRKQAQKKCTQMIWEQMAFECHDIIVKYTVEEKAATDGEEKIKEELAKLGEIIEGLEEEIAEKSKQTVNTTAAKDSINQLIRDAGFQGFEIRDKKNAQYVYELVRKDGSVVQKLSEGETNFIGFLYFYNMVMNSQSDDGIQRDKVVVIDDPISSMDSSALFSIAALVRNLIEIAYNNYSFESDGPDFIKQIICLTHNPFFFKEISYSHVSDYECVNLYQLTKDINNKTRIKLCIEEKDGIGGGLKNYSPVKNTYDALWEEYKTTDNPTILMNVIRRILEFYFLQIGGYKGQNLRKDVLDKSRENFPTQWEYDSAAAMIAYINAGAVGFDEGLYFDANAVDVDQLRSVFRNIFHALKQDQHYEHMMQ